MHAGSLKSCLPCKKTVQLFYNSQPWEHLNLPVIGNGFYIEIQYIVNKDLWIQKSDIYREVAVV